MFRRCHAPMIMLSVRTACCVTGCLARRARLVNVRCQSTALHAAQVPRFYAAQLPPVVGRCVELDPEEAKHAVRVLRLRANDAVELCDGNGRIVRCLVTHTDKNSAVVSAVQEPQTLPWNGPEWVLAVGCLTLKGGRTDWLVEKATELGARSLVPLITQRSQSAGKNKFKVSATTSNDSSAAGEFNAGRLERLAVAATKQSLRAHALQLQAPTAVEALLPLVRASPLSLLATAGAPHVVQALAAASQPPSKWCNQTCYLLVGPEGDFTPEEVAALTAAGALPVGLGPNRLRTETAALALLSTAAMYAEAQLHGVGPGAAAHGTT